MGEFSADTSEVARFAAQVADAAAQLAELTTANTEAGRVVIAATRPPIGATGQLSAGVHADATANGVTWASSARYWTFVHWGAPRRNMRARPFFVEAIQRSTSDLVAVYTDHASDVVKGIS
jgi:hypothetical protein